jgi:hypothetical protein
LVPNKIAGTYVSSDQIMKANANKPKMNTRTVHNPACKAQMGTDVAWEVTKSTSVHACTDNLCVI